MFIGLVEEVRAYAGMEIGSEVDNIPLKVINQYIIPYSEYKESLMEKFGNLPLSLRKYVNVEKMVYDEYQKEKILVFRFDPQDNREEFFSDDEELEEPDHTCGFINGVKLLDDYDIREQITANEFTGGYWDPELHWILDIPQIRRLAREETIKKQEKAAEKKNEKA